MKKSKQWIAHLLILFLCFTAIPVCESKAQGSTTLSGVAHVQTYGNQNGKITTENGVETLTLGTRGQAKRVESVTINFVNNTGYTGTIQYQVHRQTYGWTDWVNAGTPAGTTGEAKRLEAIRIRLTGELANHYNVRYCTHIQTYGDNQGWVYNGALAGTTGEAKRLEEIKIQIVPKTSESSTPAISYRVHRQTYGWENTWTNAGGVSGTTGQAKRLEGITITVNDKQYNGGITYRTHVQSYGWMDWVSDGQMSGTQGQSKRLEAIQIKLTGELANHYDIYYRVHAQHFGWMAWVKNGAMSGTSGYAYRLEAIQIVLVKKGGSEPPTTYAGVTQTQDFGYQNKDEQKNNSGSTECSHSWKQQYKTVTIPAKTHTEEKQVLVEEAWDEDTYEKHWFCGGCGEDITYLSSLDRTTHSYVCQGGSNIYTKDVLGTPIHHDAVYETQTVTVVDEPEHTEEVPDGYVCTICGATK